MNETIPLCTETICYISKAQTTEGRTNFEGLVDDDQILPRVRKGKKTLRNSEDIRAEKKALLILKSQFEKLGYKVGRINDPSISAKVIYDFQRLCGIYDGEGGTLIGEKTVKALITASKAGKKWKKKVAGMHDKTPQINTIALKGARERISSLVIKNALNLRDVGKDKRIEPIREAYAILGLIKFEKVVEAEDFIFANYKFQIISGANEKRSLAANFGPATHSALKRALEAAEQGEDWKKAFKVH